MSYRPRHEWKDGASILGAQLSHCAHCETTRVTDPARHPQPRYIRRAKDSSTWHTDEGPPCIAPIVSREAAARIDAMEKARRRELALREQGQREFQWNPKGSEEAS